MRLKVIRARRMPEAMARLRAELGEDAVILSIRRVAGEVELTAALEPQPAEEEAPEDEPLLIPPSAPVAARGVPAPAMAATAASVSVPTAPGNGGGSCPLLARHNLPPALAARLSDGPLEPALAAALRFAPLPTGRDRPLLLVGPPGAGKTLSCAKLATRLVMRGTPPLVVTADGERAGAAEQLAAFTRVLGLTLAVAAGAGALGKALARRAPGQPVLVDMPGCDPFDPEAARAIAALTAAAGGEALLVLPAGLDPGEAADLARAFAVLGARHLLPTRLDAVRRLGGVLAAAAAADLALTEAGTGPGAAGGLTELTPAWLARRLTTQGAAAPANPAASAASPSAPAFALPEAAV